MAIAVASVAIITAIAVASVAIITPITMFLASAVSVAVVGIGQSARPNQKCCRSKQKKYTFHDQAFASL